MEPFLWTSVHIYIQEKHSKLRDNTESEGSCYLIAFRTRISNISKAGLEVKIKKNNS